MPVTSYLAYPRPGRRDALARRLKALPQCEAIAAENRNLVMLVTDAPDEEAEQKLRAALEAVEELALLSLVFAQEGAIGDEL